jgi:hypothetical protein
MPRLGFSADEQQLPRFGPNVKGFLLDENLPGRLTFQPSLPVHHATSFAANTQTANSGNWQSNGSL